MPESGSVPVSGSSEQPRQRVKVIASKNKGPKGAHQMPALEFCLAHKRNPYRVPQEPSLVTRPFWNKMQQSIYHDVLKGKKNLYVKVKSVDLTHMEKDLPYFGAALQRCEELDIKRIISFNKDFDAELVA